MRLPQILSRVRVRREALEGGSGRLTLHSIHIYETAAHQSL